MTTSHQETDELNSSNRERIEKLEEQNTRVLDILSELKSNMAELKLAVNVTSRDKEEQKRTIDALRRETHENVERIERRIVEGQAPRREMNGQRHDAFVDGAETSVTGSIRELPQHELRRGGRVENNRVVVERWIPNVDHPTRTHSVREEYQDVRLERPPREEAYEAEFEHEQEYGRPYYRGDHYERRRDHHEGGYDVDRHENRRGNRAYDRGPKRPKVDFPKFNGGDPYEWLDKVDHYFHTYEVPRHERVSTACFYLEGKASKWWRWIRDQYEKERRRLGWTAFEKEFLMQFGPSPTINHHGQLAKLRQEGKVHAYIEEFRQLQTLVRGWSEEALVGTFVDGLKPWIAKEIKLKQPSKIQEVMRMAEILEESTNMEKRQSKEVGSKVTTPLQTNVPWKGKEEMGSASKSKRIEVKKLSREEVQERIKKGLCFKCGDKWGIGHKCGSGQVYMLVDERSVEEEDEYLVETCSEESDQEEAKVKTNNQEAELSLNTLMGTQKHTSLKVMAWIGAFEVPLLVDSGSTHNFVNTNIVAKVGLKPISIEPFDVRMASGDKMKCEGLVKEVNMNVQGVRVVADLHVLPLVGLDVVLGTPWLKGLGRIVLDYNKRTMEFKLGSKKNVWATLSSKETKSGEVSMLEKIGQWRGTLFSHGEG